MADNKTATDSFLKWGVFSALVASLCCIGPLVLVLLGIGGASTALAIGYRKPYFLVLGVAIFVIGLIISYRRTCKNERKDLRQQLAIFIGTFIVAGLLYYLLTFVLTPIIAPWVYQLRFGG